MHCWKILNKIGVKATMLAALRWLPRKVLRQPLQDLVGVVAEATVVLGEQRSPPVRSVSMVRSRFPFLGQVEHLLRRKEHRVVRSAAVVGARGSSRPGPPAGSCGRR